MGQAMESVVHADGERAARPYFKEHAEAVLIHLLHGVAEAHGLRPQRGGKVARLARLGGKHVRVRA